MTPYAHLAQHYDALFRLNLALVTFVERTLDGLAGKRIVEAGFASLNVLGGFDGDAFTTESPVLVLVGSDSASGQS